MENQNTGYCVLYIGMIAFWGDHPDVECWKMVIWKRQISNAKFGSNTLIITPEI
jgi:hypothetical protein